MITRIIMRVYVRGLRIHHGAVGAALVAIGIVLVFHDRRDFPFPIHDRIPPVHYNHM